MRTITIAAALGAGALLLAPCCHAQTAAAPSADHHITDAENTGQDPTRPLDRLDLRLKYAQTFHNNDIWVATGRYDARHDLGKGWTAVTRFDVPLIYTEVPPMGQPSDDIDVGLGDVLMQLLAIAPTSTRTSMAIGAELILPTASQDQMGYGKVILGPTIAVIQQQPEWGRGSFYGLVSRVRWSIGGDGERTDINEFVLQPLVNLALPDRWFITMAPEILFNLEHEGDVFFPFDLTFGRKINDRTVLSLQTDIALASDYEQYDWQTEARVGFFF